MVTQDVILRLRDAEHVTCLTGAGLSAPSGVPTFRGEDGLWKNYRAEDLATPEAFEQDPHLVWEWYDLRRKHLAKCKPNRGHEVLVAWEQLFPNFKLITQNVDGLHERAGQRSIRRFHGSIWELKCAEACPHSPKAWWNDCVDFESLPPKCQHCGSFARPGVVWFGEMIEPEILEHAYNAAECDVFLSIGTSSQVYPAAGLLESAKRLGAYTIEINLESSAPSYAVDAVLLGSADDVLVALQEGLEQSPST